MARPTPTPAHFFGGTNMRVFLCPGPTSATDVTVSSAGFTLSPDDVLKQAIAFQLNTSGLLQTAVDLVSSGADVSTGVLGISGGTVDYSAYTVLGVVADKDAT